LNFFSSRMLERSSRFFLLVVLKKRQRPDLAIPGLLRRQPGGTEMRFPRSSWAMDRE
jgi:hypothetical protein